MRILTLSTVSFSGLGRVFAALGHDVTLWRPDIKPAFDAFVEFQPDLFFGTTFGLDRALIKCLTAHPETRVVLQGSFAHKELQQGSIVPVTHEAELAAVSSLRERSGKPDLIIGNVLPDAKDDFLGHWDVPTLAMPPAADTFLFYQEIDADLSEYACEVGYVGNYWPYQAARLDEWLLPLCKEHHVKIWGQQPWPVPEHAGFLPDEDVHRVYNAATVCPNISQPHAVTWPLDLPSRPFQILASGGFCISDYCPSLQTLLGERSLLMAATPSELQELIVNTSEEQRLAYRRAGYVRVINEHTYFDRAATLLQAIDMASEAERAMQLFQQVMDKRHGRDLLPPLSLSQPR